MARLSEAQAQLFLEPNFGTVATLGADGWPQLSVVWVDYDGENVLFNTAAGRAKPRNIERDPRVSILVYDRETGYRYVVVKGEAELDPDGAVEHADRLARKYTGRDSFGVAEDEQRLIVRVRPQRVEAYGFD